MPFPSIFYHIIMNKYRAKTNFSTSISLPNGKYKYIDFDPEGNGTSIYQTNSAVIAAALERNPGFGKVFTLEYTDDPVEEAQKAEAPAPVKSEKEYNEVKVNDYEEAKRYLIEELGYPANKVRTQSAILKVAANENITFVM